MLFSKYLCVPFVRTFGFSATSTYNSYLPLIFGKFPWIWCYFQNICVCRLWGLWGQRRPHGQKAGFWGWKKSNKCKKNQISNFGFISYGHFSARNGSKSTIVTQKLKTCWLYLIFEEDFLLWFWFFFSLKIPLLELEASFDLNSFKNIGTIFLKISSNKCKFSKD